MMSNRVQRLLLLGGLAAVGAVLVLQVLIAGGMPDPLGQSAFGARVLDIAVLVFREGLECILVLAAITTNMRGEARGYQRPVAAGAGVAFVASLVTWFAAVRVLDSLSDSMPALDLQAATGLLAIIVLLIVMNWFFHKVYWTGWISMHSRTKQALLRDGSPGRIWWGLALLGFTSLYREGFEIVLFLQSYRLKLGGLPVLYGVCTGLALTVIVGALTFVAQRRLPYRRMLVVTGARTGAAGHGGRAGAGDAAGPVAADDARAPADSGVGQPVVRRVPDRRNAGRAGARRCFGARVVLPRSRSAGAVATRARGVAVLRPYRSVSMRGSTSKA